MYINPSVNYMCLGHPVIMTYYTYTSILSKLISTYVIKRMIDEHRHSGYEALISLITSIPDIFFQGEKRRVRTHIDIHQRDHVSLRGQ